MSAEPDHVAPKKAMPAAYALLSNDLALNRTDDVCSDPSGKEKSAVSDKIWSSGQERRLNYNTGK